MLGALCRSLTLLALMLVNTSCAEERHWLSLKTDAVTIGVDRIWHFPCTTGPARPLHGGLSLRGS